MGSSRLNIRFHIDDEKKTLLNYPASYKVKKISLGGMLVECVLPLEIESKIPMELFLHDDNIIRFVGRVASCLVLEADGQELYDIGIEFLELTDKKKDILKSFVDYCAAIEVRDKAD